MTRQHRHFFLKRLTYDISPICLTGYGLGICLSSFSHWAWGAFPIALYPIYKWRYPQRLLSLLIICFLAGGYRVRSLQAPSWSYQGPPQHINHVKLRITSDPQYFAHHVTFQAQSKGLQYRVSAPANMTTLTYGDRIDCNGQLREITRFYNPPKGKQTSSSQRYYARFRIHTLNSHHKHRGNLFKQLAFSLNATKTRFLSPMPHY